MKDDWSTQVPNDHHDEVNKANEQSQHIQRQRILEARYLISGLYS